MFPFIFSSEPRQKINTQTNIHNSLFYMVKNIHFNYQLNERICKTEKKKKKKTRDDENVISQVTALSHNLIFLIAENGATTAYSFTFERKLLVWYVRHWMKERVITISETVCFVACLARQWMKERIITISESVGD